MAKRIVVCVVVDPLGGGVGVITVGCAGDVCAGVVPERYGQVPYIARINSRNSSGSRLDLLHRRKYEKRRSSQGRSSM